MHTKKAIFPSIFSFSFFPLFIFSPKGKLRCQKPAPYQRKAAFDTLVARPESIFYAVGQKYIAERMRKKW